MQRKTGLPVRFELSEQTREAVQAWIEERQLGLRLPVPQSVALLPKPLNAAVCADRERPDRVDPV